MQGETRVCSRCGEEKLVSKQFLPKGKICWDCREAARIASNVNWRSRNKVYLREYRNAHREANPEKYVQKTARRRAAKLEAKGDFKAEDIQLHYQLQEGMCVYCQSCLEDSCAVDHIFPISKYFYDGPENLQLLCKSCNSSKNDKEPYDYEKKIGFLTPEREEKLNSIKAIVAGAREEVGNFEEWRRETRRTIIRENTFEEEIDWDIPWPPEYYHPRYTYEMWGYF